MSNKDYHNPDSSEQAPAAPTTIHHRQRRRSRSPMNHALRQIQKWLRWQVIVMGLLVFSIVGVMTLSVLITDATTRLENAWESLNRVLIIINNQSGTELTLNDFNRLQSSLYELDHRLATTRSRLRFIGPVAKLNPDWAASIDALDVSQQLVEAAESMLVGLQPALDFMVQGEDDEAVATRISSGERVVELLELGRGQFVNAQNRLRVAGAQLDEIDLAHVSANLLLQIEQMRGYHQQLQDINSVVLSLPDVLTTLLGLDTDRTYLVLAQNNDEIRPSGGYISTYGWFTVSGGRIMDFDYNPTTATSPIPPPDSFADTFTIPDWWIRYGKPVYAAWDGSWYADFPQTAQMAMDYYNTGRNPKAPVDGVLAIDVTGFELMLGALGEVPVEEYNVTVTTDNFRERVYDIRAFGEGELPHKRFVAAIYRAIFQEWRSINQERTPDLLGALLEGVQTRHIMIYLADDNINAAIDTIGWDGAQIPATENDYIMIADANLGNKSNNSIARSMTYDVTILPDGGLHSRLSARYDYFASVAENDPAVDGQYHGPVDYYDLMQVFVPVGATLTDTNNVAIAYTVERATHTLFIAHTEVNYDTGERFQFMYDVSPVVETIGDYQRYRLLIQKQPGARIQDTNVQVTLPENAVVVSSSPQADASYSLEQPILDFRLQLDSDQWIEVIYQIQQASE